MKSFTVSDMTCGHCVSTITRAIQDVDSSAKVKIDLGKRVVGIGSDRPASEFLAAIRAAGYSPVIGSNENAANAASCCQS